MGQENFPSRDKDTLPFQFQKNPFWFIYFPSVFQIKFSVALLSDRSYELLKKYCNRVSYKKTLHDPHVGDEKW